MRIEATNIADYLSKVEESKREAFSKLRDVVVQNLPEGFVECLHYGMIGYVVPHSIYPAGYHCDPKEPLSFLHIAAQKNYIAVYSAIIYMDDDIKNWFSQEYVKVVPTKLDMGKSCIRLKKHVPYELIGELIGKMSMVEFIQRYEKTIK